MILYFATQWSKSAINLALSTPKRMLYKGINKGHSTRLMINTNNRAKYNYANWMFGWQPNSLFGDNYYHVAKFHKFNVMQIFEVIVSLSRMNYK